MVYIIVLNYQIWQDTIECIESLLNLDYDSFKVIMIDNDSPNDSMKQIESWASGETSWIPPQNSPLKDIKVTEKPISFQKIDAKDINNLENITQEQLILIQSEKNGGYAAGNNIGIDFALSQNDCEYIWILNNDIVVENNSLTKLVNKSKSYEDQKKKIGIIGSKIMYYSQPDKFQYVGGGTYINCLATGKAVGKDEIDNQQYDIEHLKLDLISGACMFVNYNFIEVVGKLCEDYFLYSEEIDWAERGRRNGNWKLGYAYKAKVYHKISQSIGNNQSKGKVTKSSFSDYYNIRARVLYTRRFHPYYLLVFYTGFVGVLFNRIIRCQFKRIPLLIKAVLVPKRNIYESR